MRSHARFAAWLLPFVLTGCAHLPQPFHKTQQAKAQPFAPPIKSTHLIELASIELPADLCIIPAQPIFNMPEPEEPIIPPLRHRKPPARPDDANSAPDSTPAVSAIGELSSGDPANYRQQTEDLIGSIERGLNGINRPLDDTEQRTADHIREFLKQAKAALASGDVDGAHTLAAKAQVLLTELNR